MNSEAISSVGASTGPTDAEIDAVDASVRSLEDTVAALDAYTAELAAAASSALEKSPPLA